MRRVPKIMFKLLNSLSVGMITILFNVCLLSNISIVVKGSALQEGVMYTRAGIRVIKVEDGRKEAKLGIKDNDLIVRYGEKEIKDLSSFFAAQEFYIKSSTPTVQLVLWRNMEQIELTIPVGKLNLDVDEYNRDYSLLHEFIDSNLRTLSISPEEYQHSVKAGHIKPYDEMVKEVEVRLAKAEKEQILTPEQILITRIYMIPEKASSKENEKRLKLLDQLLTTQPTSFIYFLGHHFFDNRGRYIASIESLKHYLKIDPANRATVVKLFDTYRRLQRYKDAEDVVINNRLEEEAKRREGIRSRSRIDYSKDWPPLDGLRVTEVFPDSPSLRAGLKVGDIIIKYGNRSVVDMASYYVAREAYKTDSDANIELGVKRNGRNVILIVPPGRLGFQSIDQRLELQCFYALMNDYDQHRNLEEFGLAKPESESSQHILQHAANIIRDGQRQGTLTSSQVLLAKIYMIPDNGTAADDQTRLELLKELFANYPLSMIVSVGNDELFGNGRNKAAVECLKHYLKDNPNDISIRLNMGVAYSRLHIFDKAKDAADYVLDNKLPLSEYGYSVAFNIKAIAALGNKDYASCIAYNERSISLSPSIYNLNIWLLALAKIGNVRQFQLVRQIYKKAFPDDYISLEKYLDAVEVYLRVKNKEMEEARRIVAKWKSEPDITKRVRKYWSSYPVGLDIADMFARVMENNILLAQSENIRSL
jgi:tetratricopeptide (TPR) repeat protein